MTLSQIEAPIPFHRILLRSSRKHRRVPSYSHLLIWSTILSLRGFLLNLKTLLKVIPMQSNAERTIIPRILLSLKTLHLTDLQLMEVSFEKYDLSSIFMVPRLIARILLLLSAKKNHSHRAKNYHPSFAPDP